ncbi:hypothetical protein FDECE_15821 [Fusarium decemcellulare]|nr:hypothetical protein FDECE_15821 [Fusarium decemcellulare]
MNPAEGIVRWLSQIDPSESHIHGSSLASATSSSSDRDQCAPLSPPKSPNKRVIMTCESDYTPKRRKLDGNIDFDETPRANSNVVRPGCTTTLRTATPTTSLPPPSSESQSTRSRISGYSSPAKQITALELNPKGLERRVLSLGNRSLPSALSDLLVDLDMCSNGHQVISKGLESEIKQHAGENPEFRVFLNHVYTSPDQRDVLGPTPPIEEVTKLVKDAAEAQASRQNEAGWNMMVHWPLLDSAIYGRRRQDQLVGFACCTTAKIIKEYLPTTSQAKMIDFGIYISLEAENSSEVIDAVENLRRALPCNVINHTDFDCLRNRPLAVSIETKKRNSISPEAAEIQLGTWHAAQWKFLEDLVKRSRGSFDGLPFLPAVIVNGHEWSFAATTKEGQKTILWLEKGFGSTSSSLGVFKVVWGLQRLAKWVREVYWPWYKTNALGLLPPTV